MRQEWSKYKLVVFDLDNTLYRETDYLFAAYRRIAERCAADPKTAEEYYSYLCTSFAREGRADLFQRFKDRYAVALSIPQMLEILRTTECALTIYPAKKDLIAQLLENGKKVAILTNGNSQQQRQKIANLQIKELFPQVVVVYASEIESKPSPRALQQLMAQTGVRPEETLFVGDGETDCRTAANAGVDFVYTTE